MALTGRFNLRKSFSGRIILQVEEEVESAWGFFSRKTRLRRRWRDAKPMDLPATELRGLMDLRNHPRVFMPSFEPRKTVGLASHQSNLVQPTVSNPASKDEGQPATAH